MKPAEKQETPDAQKRAQFSSRRVFCFKQRLLHLTRVKETLRKSCQEMKMQAKLKKNEKELMLSCRFVANPEKMARHNAAIVIVDMPCWY